MDRSKAGRGRALGCPPWQCLFTGRSSSAQSRGRHKGTNSYTGREFAACLPARRPEKTASAIDRPLT